MNTIRELNQQELEALHPGEAITLTTVMAVMAIALLAIVCYKLFMSKSGKASLGNYKFEWGSAK